MRPFSISNTLWEVLQMHVFVEDGDILVVKFTRSDNSRGFITGHKSEGIATSRVTVSDTPEEAMAKFVGLIAQREGANGHQSQRAWLSGSMG